MSKKEKRRKNNRAKKIFDKSLLIEERQDALQELEITKKIRDKEEEKESNLEKNIEPRETNVDKTKDRKKLDKTKNVYDKFLIKLKKWNNIFCTGMTCRVNLKRDFFIIFLLILILALALGIDYYMTELKRKLNERQNQIVPKMGLINEVTFEEKNIEEITTIQEKMSADTWKDYQSAWYGFKIKYPDEWRSVVQPYSRLSKAIFRVSFLSNNQTDKNFIGFDVAVYDINRTKEFFQTDEFPKLKESSLVENESCKNIEGHLLETGDYPAEEIYISREDDCYNAALFFTVVEGQYIYNMVPRMRDGVLTEEDPMVEISDTLPEFFVAISQFENIDIVRPKPKPVPPKITAPKPASYKVINGRLVCAKNKDKPAKSDKNKKKHLDMECCLDPDEYPNPHCYYDPGKYSKYMK